MTGHSALCAALTLMLAISMLLHPAVISTHAASSTQSVTTIRRVIPGGLTNPALRLCDLQTALNLSAPNDQIWAAEGTYYPTSRTLPATFSLLPDVVIYGGFAGTETAISLRNWRTHPSILSGDIDRDRTGARNVYHVVTASQLTIDSSTVCET